MFDGIEQSIAKATKHQDAVEAIIARFEPKIAQAFIQAITAHGKKVNRKALVEALDKRDVTGVLRAMNLDQLELGRLIASIQQAYSAAGTATAETSPAAKVAFDAFSPRSAQTVQRIGDTLRRTLTAEASEAVNVAMQRHLARGANPRSIATEIGNIVGLTERQTVAVDNYRKALEGKKTEALLRALRDKRYDAAIRTARSKAEPIPRKKIKAMVARYAQRQLRARGMAIARTEAARAANLGSHEAILQSLDQGGISHNRLRRHWVLARTEATCLTCGAVPRRNKAGVGVAQPFDTATGPVLMPPLHPNCRCTIAFRLPML